MYFIDPTGMSSDDWKRDINQRMVYDEKLNVFNQSYMLGFGETYVGETHYEPTGNNTGLRYNENGTIDPITVLNEVVVNALGPNNKSSFFDITNGTTIYGSDRSGNTHGLSGITTNSIEASNIPGIGGSAAKVGQVSILGTFFTAIKNFFNGANATAGTTSRVEQIVNATTEANEKETKPNQSDNSMMLKSYDKKSGNYHWVRKESNIKEEKK